VASQPRPYSTVTCQRRTPPIPAYVNMHRVRLVTALAALCISVLSAMPAAAAPGGNGGNDKNNGNSGHANTPPSVAATPELDSLLLFGTGAVGMAGYALMRLRARGRQDGASGGDSNPD
jgi:hypothetical protein